MIARSCTLALASAVTGMVLAVGVSPAMACESAAVAGVPEQATPPPAIHHHLPVAARDELGTIIAIDPRVFFEMLVARYRALGAYSDVTSIVQVTQRFGELPEHGQRIETRVLCDIAAGKLNVRTPASQIRHALGLVELPFDPPHAVQEAQLDYELWLLPHMTLRFADNPLEQFRAGVPEGFTATEAAPVTIDEKPMVHLELKSGDGMSDAYNARFDLYVDPDSMLIERIQGEQRLPDGGNLQTSLEITPLRAEIAPACDPALCESQPAAAEPLTEPVAEPFTEPLTEPFSEPIAEPVSEPVAAPPLATENEHEHQHGQAHEAAPSPAPFAR
jgi:hypothetical protein